MIEPLKSSLSLPSLYKVCDDLEFAMNKDIKTKKSTSRTKFRHFYNIKHFNVP